MNFKITLMLFLSSFLMNAQTIFDDAIWEYQECNYGLGTLINYQDALVVLQSAQAFKITGDNERTDLSGVGSSDNETGNIPAIVYNGKLYYQGASSNYKTGYL
ncbi:MAG: hypothetical protein N4A74_02205 [Carboxylicivirga sp.]|jgi:hypothetical protein|nr:hypothetical protein [Carboxylicivirga sp.]